MELKRVFVAPGPRLPSRSTVIGAVLVAAVGVLVGVLSAGFSDYALPAAVGVLMVGVAALDLSLIPVIALPATLVAARIGGAVSISDVVLFVATIFAMLMLRRRGAVIVQPLLWAGVAYLAVSIPTLILNPYVANAIEWLHEVFLVLGSMIIGFVIGRENKARLALSLYLIACAGIGVVAVVAAFQSLFDTGVFQPVYLGDLHKNAIGGMLAAALVIAYARPVWLGWSRRWAYLVAALCALGIISAQSRQGLIGAMVGVLIVTLRPLARGRRRGRLIWLVFIPVVALVISELNNQLASGDPFNSAHQRLTWLGESIGIWLTSPAFGVGMRWWYTSRFGDGFQPPNAELEVLTTVGIVGLVGFLAMFVVAAWLLGRLDPMYGTVGLAVVATRFTQAQFDLYWVAGQASLLWIVAGICYGVLARDRALAAAKPLNTGVAEIASPIRAGRAG